MLENQVKILGGFLSQGELTYKDGVFKGFIAQPEQRRTVTLSFSEHCIDQIQLLQYIKSGVFSKDAYFSIILTDGRELKVKATEKTYQKIYEKSLSSRKTPTLIIEKPFDFITTAKWLAVSALVLAGFSFCKSDPTPEPTNNTSVTTENLSSAQNTDAKSVLSTGEACRFRNFDVSSWKSVLDDGNYTCSSNPFDVSPDQMDGSLPNYLMYAAQGSQNYVAQVKVKLYVNNTSFRTGSTNKFIEACNSLSSKVSGKKLPNSMVNAIKNRKDGSQKVNGFSVTIETDTWESGNGYEQNCIMRR